MMRRIVLAAALVLALVPLACGGDDDGDGDGNGNGGGTICEQACKKMEDCNPGTVCQVNGACDSENDKKISQCIVDKPCAEMQSCFLGG